MLHFQITSVWPLQKEPTIFVLLANIKQYMPHTTIDSDFLGATGYSLQTFVIVM